MPKTVTIRPAAGFKTDDPAAKALHKSLKPKVVSYQTALENCRLSGGMYEIAPEKNTPVASQAPALEDMDLSDLKVLMLQSGIKTEKQMTRSQVIVAIRKQLEKVELVEDSE